jgi:hypothetical protein
VQNDVTSIMEQDPRWHIAYCAEAPGVGGPGNSLQEYLANPRRRITLIQYRRVSRMKLKLRLGHARRNTTRCDLKTATAPRFVRKPYPLVNGAAITWGAWSALDVNTGKILWQTADPNQALDMGSVSVANGLLYAPSYDGNMHALDAATGKTLWSFQSGGAVLDGPSIVDGVVYWGSGYRNSRRVPGTTRCTRSACKINKKPIIRSQHPYGEVSHEPSPSDSTDGDITLRKFARYRPATALR